MGLAHRPGSTVRATVRRLRGGLLGDAETDSLAVEEPLEVRLVYGPESERVTQSVSVTMRTPGHDFELAAGFLYTEGVIPSHEAIEGIGYCTDPGVEQEYNIVNVALRPWARFEPGRLLRHFYTSSSCGVCGKATLEAIHVRGCPMLPGGVPQLPASVVPGLPETLRRAQRLFDRTGGLHAAGLFDTRGDLLSLREDVGRHNAVDKLVGEQLLAGALPLHDRVLVLSGRASFELLQKALVAGIPLVVAVGAPSSLAVGLARDFDITLIGFARGDSFNIYTGAERIVA
ncbi:MAG: formate dehydrogenase accessory sulfurtransferase FdhD [Chloroflexi bacterium]|nr:formate dehydrogenase accessory sulfurtransferase FdhD [Chloroflexota bacterium]